jgi:excisionase family DNA binding protein
MKRGANRETYDLPEVAQRLGIGRAQAYQAAKRGEIPAIKIGKRLLVSKAALDRLLDGSVA